MLFDDVLEQIGEGIFQKFAIVVCGLSVLAEAIATTCVPFAMILVSCDLKVTIDQILALNAVFILAMLISAYWLGGVSDISGRKLILSTTSIITFVGCFVASFSQCVIMLFISLFLLGFGLGGNHSATRIFIIEITPKSIRGSRFILLEIFSAVGYASAIGLSRLLVPHSGSSLLGSNVRLNSWRILFGLSGSLSIFSSCLMSVFPASPRWLLGKKHEDSAIDILRKIFAVNKVKHEESFPQNIRLDSITYVDTRLEPHNYQCNNPFIRSLRSIRIYTGHLFTKAFVKTTLTGILISIFLFDGLVMMNIWLSLTLFTHDMDECVLNGASPVVPEANHICNEARLQDLFKLNAYLSISSFFLVAVLCAADRIPRKYILMFSSLVVALATLGLIFISHNVFRTALAFVVLSFMFVTEITFRIILFESYPTVLRCTAYGFIKMFAKVPLIFLMVFLRVPCIWAFISFSAAFASVRMALKYLGLEFELIDVDFLSGYHMSEEYAKMNPQKEIPVLDDDGFYLSESNAILQYLADCYSKIDGFYPKDSRTRAIVNHRLAFNLSTYYRNIGEHVMLPIFFGYERTPLTAKKVNMSLSVFNTYLEKLNKKFAASDELTIADLQLVTATLCLEAINFDLSPYPKVSEWYERFKTEHPGIWSIAEKGMKEIEGFNKNPPDLSHLNHPIHSFGKVKSS